MQDDKKNKMQITKHPTIDLEESQIGDVEQDIDNGTEYEKELLNSLIESEKDKVHFQNTRNNVSIANTHRTNSKMCSLM